MATSDANSVPRETMPDGIEIEDKPAPTGQTIILEVQAAYNRDGLPLPRPNGPNGRRVLDMEMLLHHPFYWEWLNENETTEVLMELYVARTRRAQ